MFITGTDTDVGKTWVSCAILDALAAAGHAAFALKPIAAGARNVQGEWRNEDALALMRHASVSLAYEAVNPCVLQAAVAPHVAAEWEGKTLALAPLVQHCRTQLQAQHGYALVEGAGGWRVPLNARESLADLAIQLGLPVVLVVPIRLGCLNHALLTAEAIRHDGLLLAGWVANMVRADYAPSDALIQSLEQELAAPCLGRFPWYDADRANAPDPASVLDLPVLLNAFGAMRKQS